MLLRRATSKPLQRNLPAQRHTGVQLGRNRGELEMRGRRPKPTRLKLLTGNPGQTPFECR
jgi:hypothetical protein